MSNEKITTLPNYKTPPVNEVVCGLSFTRIKNFKSHHIGLFWQKIKNEFPIVEHAMRLEYKPPEFDIDMKEYLPRVWFIKKEGNRLIQLQNDMFYFNWRKIEEDETYPRYETIFEDFKKYQSIFEKFLEEENLGMINPERCELAYINHIPKGEGWESVIDAVDLFSDFCWNTRDRFLPPPISVGGKAVFQLPDSKGHLEITLRQALRKTDKCPMFVLDNKAIGLGEDKNMDAVWEWFDVAHKWIVCGFKDLTTENVQKDVWQRTDTSG